MCLKVGLEFSTSHDEGEDYLLHFAVFCFSPSKGMGNEVDDIC